MDIFTETIPIHRIKPHPKNNVKHPQAQIALLRKSIRDFTYVRLIVVQEPSNSDGDYVLVAGEGITTAARMEGMKELECRIIPAAWSDDKVLAYLIADNKLGDGAEIDDGKTAAILARINPEMQQATGIDPEQLSLILADAQQVADAEPVQPDPDVPILKTTEPELKAPFPWFGGKRLVGAAVWERFGDVANYVEPFCGSMAVALARPTEPRIETVNDADAYLTNFFRAIKADSAAVAKWATWPVSELDLHARHKWLIEQSHFREKLRADPDYFDPKVAGWWVWGLCSWIGGGWCKSNHKRLPHMGMRGINRQSLQRPHLRPSQGINQSFGKLTLAEYLKLLENRIANMRIVCGDWSRVLTPSVTVRIGMTGVFLDPPYAADRSSVYAEESFTISNDVRNWCLETVTIGDYRGARYQHPKLRIALCGYESEHAPYMPDDWTMTAWNAGKGYAGQRQSGQNDNGRMERIWFSPNCLLPEHE